MVEGILLICDECIDISQDVKILRFEDNWRVYRHGELMESSWESAKHICEGLGGLFDEQMEIGRLIWEDGYMELLDYDEGMVSTEILFGNIVYRVGLLGLMDMAFEIDIAEIIDEYTLGNRSLISLKEHSDIGDLKIYKVKTDGGEIIQYKTGIYFYYAMLNKEKTQWIVDIDYGCSDVKIIPSGTMVFKYITPLKDIYAIEMTIVYGNEKIVDTFFGDLKQIDGSSNLFEYRYDERKPLIIGDTVSKSDCIVRIWKSSIEFVIEL